MGFTDWLRNRRGAFSATLACLMALTAGIGVLVADAPVADAGVTPGIKPDFVVGPGDIVPLEVSKPLVGSAEAKGDPQTCREDVAFGLTCAAHRLKVNRTADPSYQLSIVLEWDAQGDPGIIQVPDVDMFLYDNPTAPFDSTLVGGAGATAPEQIKIVPKADEYDIVVQAYAGAITGYKLTVSYLNTATLAGNVTPDIVLSPHQPPFNKQYDSVIAAGAPAVLWLPDGCRNDPTADNLCDVYRVKLNRNKSKEATNFVVFTLDWDAVVVPSLATPAVGTAERPVPDLNIYVYDAPDHELEGIGGASVGGVPERLGFVATQDEYDIVVQSAGGMGTSYRLTGFMSDEIFDKPFELLDPLTGETLRQQPDGSLIPVPDASGSSAQGPASLELAPIDVDGQIAGIGLGATEQFDSDQLLELGRGAMRTTASSSTPPSAMLLWLALVIAPLGLLGGGVWFMRRRHSDAF